MKPKCARIAFLVLLLLLAAACSNGAPAAAPASAPALEAAPEVAATSAPPAATATRQPTPTPTEAPYTVIEGVAYVPDGHWQQKLDIYLPQGPGSFPTVLVISEAGLHSASWSLNSDRGNYSDVTRLQYRSLALALVEMGYAAVIMDFRLVPDFVFPAQLQDAFCALAWLHATAGEYGFDAQRVAALGVLSGADVVALLGAVDDPASYLEGCPYALPETGYLQGVIAYSGSYDNTRDEVNPLHLAAYMGGTLEELPDRHREASALFVVDGSEPPFLLIHSLEDRNVPIAKAQNFAAALEVVGVTVESQWVPGDYTFGYSPRSAPPNNRLELDTVASFLNRIFE